ncbi:ROK family protein [Parasegetibacter sp. NRK P23]|uniref:ROK family protein n=1 Tax=Parasegetibacter sp. NRK P23 TaxID=2942999 RepID=UPI002043DD6B|nr:ROK family protein [Parasegetibacter sp. NRK P23]MCM5527712.1 ROK family protein [Parasegetibacter sp. NRK P23]
MNPKKLKYKREVVSKLYFSGELSSTDLSKLIDKSIPLTTKILGELIEEEVVLETGHASSTGGRRPVMYALKEDVYYIVCVALDQFVARITITDMQNRFVKPVEKFELALPRNPDALEALTDCIKEYLSTSGISRKKIIGIGIGMPGFVDAKKGINYSFMKTRGKSISQTISEATGLPVYIDNDSSLIALAELRFGAVKHKSNAMVVNIGWGIGLGMVLNRSLFRGQEGFAGEFSHIPLFQNGKMCSCGKTGCLETETSLLVIIEKAKKELEAGRTSMMQLMPMDHYEQASETIISAAIEGDRYAIELFSEAGYNIGRGLAILIHLLNPEVIVLSGRGASAGKVWLAPMQQALNEHCIPRLVMHTSMELSTLGYNAELIGAAALVMENYESRDVKKSLNADISVA